MPWYKVTLSVQDVHRAETLQDAFSAFFITSGSPKDAGMYLNKERGKAERVFYFSPGAAAIAMPVIKQYSGVECPAPAKSQVYRRVGDALSQDIPFAPDR